MTSNQEVSPAIGVDVGGTMTKAVLAAANGEVLRSASAPTPKGAEGVIELVQAMVLELGTVAPVGVVVPGIVDEENGIGVHCVNLGWRDIPFRDRLEQAVGCRVAFGHDVRAGLLGEAVYGAAQGVSSVLFIPIGTGIAAATASGGRFIVGGGYAGEIGHLSSQAVREDAPDDGVACGCGRMDCLERSASAASIARRWSAATGKVAQGSKEVVDAARRGDVVAEAIVADATGRIGQALAYMVGLLGTVRIVIGGGFSLAGKDILDSIAEHTSQALSVTPAPEVVRALLGDRAGALGAAELGRRRSAGQDLGRLVARPIEKTSNS